MPPDRPMRADAVRNRQKILDAARQRISTGGPDVGMDDIAQTAGVAVGTLYRHFPTKTDLVTAVLAEYVAQVADDAEASLERVRTGARAADEVASFLSRVTEASAHNHAVKSVARGLGVDDHSQDPNEARAGTALAELLRRGQADGHIAAEITVADIYLLVTTAPADQPSEVRQRWLALILPGILT